MLKASRITPGIASGATLPELKAPALPYEHPSPGSSRSIRVTFAPRRRRCQAVQTPTMPAPTTTTPSRPFLLMSIGGIGVLRHPSRHPRLHGGLRSPSLIDCRLDHLKLEHVSSR